MTTDQLQLNMDVNHQALLEEIGQERARQMLLEMMLIRTFEDKAYELYSLGKVHGTMHLSIGQEGTAVGASTALTNNDYLLNTHRGHGHCLAWGGEPKLMMARVYGQGNRLLPWPWWVDAHRQCRCQ